MSMCMAYRDVLYLGMAKEILNLL